MDPSQFINGRNQIALRYMAKNKGDSSQLDFVAFEIKSLPSKQPAMRQEQLVIGGAMETAGNRLPV